MANAEDKKKPQPAPANPAPAAAPAPRPVGNPGGAVNRPSNPPTANQTYRPAPTANRPVKPPPTLDRGEHTPVIPDQPRKPPLPPTVKTVVTPRGSVEKSVGNGNALRTRSNGKVSDVYDAQRRMDIHHLLNGGQRVVVERQDHSRIVFQKGRPGYVQHSYSFRDRDFAQRTYFYHGRAYDHLYYGYLYRGGYVYVYAPGVYYGPGFYGWAYSPWGQPIAYGWGFGGSAWYGYYGYYFAPYSSYPSASYWLTDYMISSDLQNDYAAQQQAGEVDGAPPDSAGPPELTPEVKQQIADEVRNQLALENQEASLNAQQKEVDPGSSGIDRILTDAANGKPHVFVVGSALDVVDSSQLECALSDGDVLALSNAPLPDAKAADLVVLSSKGGQECRKQAIVSVTFEDLQEMQNHMRETIDQGLQELQAKQGNGGIPAAPSSASGQPAPALYATIAPPPDPNAAADIQQQAQQATQSEMEVTAQATQPNR